MAAEILKGVYLLSLTIGIMAGGYFCYTWGRQTPKFFSWAAFDTGGWVYVLLFIYLYVLVFIVFRGMPEIDAGSPRVYGGLFLYWLIDAVILARAFRWKHMQDRYSAGGSSDRDSE